MTSAAVVDDAAKRSNLLYGRSPRTKAVLEIEEKRVKAGLESVAKNRVQQLRKRALKGDPSLIVEAGGVGFLWDGDNL